MDLKITSMKSFFIKNLIWFVIGIFFARCSGNYINETHTIQRFEIEGQDDFFVNDSVFYTGGFGSGMDKVPDENRSYYIIGDRGPNYIIRSDNKKVRFDFQTKNMPFYRGFADPDYHLKIIKITRKGKRFVKDTSIILKTPEGKHLTGLPQNEAFGEIPVCIKNNVVRQINYDDLGFDTEGLVVMQDGSFWLSDEYGPFVIHFDKNGVMIDSKIGPFHAIKNQAGSILKLPKVIAKRRPNAGMEGITAIRNDSVLVGIIQKPLHNYTNPTTTYKNTILSFARLTRIVMLNIYTGETKQFAYMQQKTGMANGELKALTDSTFLVIEQNKFNALKSKNAIKRIYKITIPYNATDLSDNRDSETGLLFEGKTPEELTYNELQKHIIPVKKELVLDIVDEYPGFHHEKVEGLVYNKNRNTLVFINDNDFGIKFSEPRGALIQRYDEYNQVDVNYIYQYKIEGKKL